MAAPSSARLSDIAFSLVIGSPGVSRRARQYIPAARPDLIAPAVKRSCGVAGALAGSAQLVDADQVARRVAEGAVANAVRLVGRLLDDLGDIAALQPREDVVEVAGGQGDDGVGSLGHHLGDGAALVVSDARVDARRVQH